MSQSFAPVDISTLGSLPSKAFWSFGQADAVVIFIHGFGGSGQSTWPDFPILLPKWAQENRRAVDVILYNYKSIRVQPVNSASLLGDFLVAFLKQPDVLIDESLSRSLQYDIRTNRQPYKRIVLVAHSLGAVVARLALLDLDEDFTNRGAVVPWLENIRMVFYAPAHHGSRLLSIRRELLGLDFIGLPVPVVDDLRTDSPFLANFRTRIDKALTGRDSRKVHHVIPNSVVWAELDAVVINMKFSQDPRATTLAGHSHVSVCKPKLGGGENIFDFVSTCLN